MGRLRPGEGTVAAMLSDTMQSPAASEKSTDAVVVQLHHDYNGKPLTWWTRLRLFLHWGPLIAEFLIFAIFAVNMFVIVPRWDALYFRTTVEQNIIRTVLVFFLLSIEVNYGMAVMRGPGWLATPSAERKKHVDSSRLQLCARCDVYKEARSHHCSVCQRCVCKQDHHCPWINRCVGYANQKNFVLFLFYASLGCLLCVVTTILCGLYGNLMRIPRGWKRNDILVYAIMVLAHFVFALATSIALLFLLRWQVQVIRTNKSDIEDWIVTKAKRRNENFVFPYAVGVSESWRLHMGANVLEQLWFTTPDNAMYNSKGHIWPMLPGCDYYSLYEEQVRQKKEKRARAIKRTVSTATTGRFFGIGHGFGLCTKCPSLYDPYARVEVGEEVECMYSTDDWTWIEVWDKGVKVRKGWIPRICVDPAQSQTDKVKERERGGDTLTETDTKKAKRKQGSKKAD